MIFLWSEIYHLQGFSIIENLNQGQQCPNKGDNSRAKMIMAYKEEREREKKMREKKKEKKGKIKDRISMKTNQCEVNKDKVSLKRNQCQLSIKTSSKQASKLSQDMQEKQCNNGDPKLLPLCMTAQYCKVQSMRCMEKERVNCATEQDSMRTKTLKVLLRECLNPHFMYKSNCGWTNRDPWLMKATQLSTISSRNLKYSKQWSERQVTMFCFQQEYMVHFTLV